MTISPNLDLIPRFFSNQARCLEILIEILIHKIKGPSNITLQLDLIGHGTATIRKVSDLSSHPVTNQGLSNDLFKTTGLFTTHLRDSHRLVLDVGPETTTAPVAHVLSMVKVKGHPFTCTSMKECCLIPGYITNQW